MIDSGTTTPTADLTELLDRWSEGDSDAAHEAVAHAYAELKEIAERCIRRERAGHTLGPTALVHEVYFRIVGERMPEMTSRAHFLGIAARLMRQVLVNHAVARKAAKRGGSWSRVPLDEALNRLETDRVDVLALNEALGALGESDPMLAKVVELRFFGGLTIEETAEVLEVSPRKVVSCWTFARAWLNREIGR